MLKNKYYVCVGGNNLLRIVDPRGVDPSVDIVINGTVLFVEGGYSEAYCISETGTTSFLTKVDYSGTPTIVYSVDLGVKRSVSGVYTTMAISKGYVYIYIDKTFIKLDMDGTEISTGILNYISGRLVGVNSLGMIVMMHGDGTDIIDNGVSKISITSVFQDIVILENDIVGFSGNYMYVMNPFLYQLNIFDISTRIEKAMSVENDIIVGFAYGINANLIYEFDKETGSKSLVSTLNEVVNCVSFTSNSTIVFDSDPGWAAGATFEVKGANNTTNNATYTVASNSGVTYTVDETNIVTDAVDQGTATKYNTPGSVTEFFSDRYGRYYLVDGESNGIVWYGLGVSVSKYSYVADIPLAAGKNQAGLGAFTKDISVKNWRMPFSRDGISSLLYSTMTSKEGTMSMFDYSKTIKHDELTSYVIVGNSILEIDNEGVLANSYATNRAVIDVDVDDKFIWILSTNHITLLHKDTMGYYKEFEYSEVGSIVSITSPSTITLDSEIELGIGDKITVSGTASNDGDYHIVTHSDGTNIYVVEEVTLVNETVSAIVKNSGKYITSLRNETALVTSHKGTYRIFSVFGKRSDVGLCDYTSSDMLHFGGHPRYSYSANGVIVPVSGSTGVAVTVPAFVIIGKGGEINGYSAEIINKDSTYETNVLPDNRGNVYVLWQDTNPDVILGEYPEGSGASTYEFNFGISVEYEGLGVNIFGDIVLLKKDDNVLDRGMYLFLRSDAGLTGESLYYKLSGDNEMKGVLGDFDRVVSGLNSELIGSSGNRYIERDVQSWIGYNSDNNSLRLIVTGGKTHEVSLGWVIKASVSIDGLPASIIGLSDNGDGIYTAGISFVDIPTYVVVDFSIEDVYANTIIKNRKIISFLKR